MGRPPSTGPAAGEPPRRHPGTPGPRRGLLGDVAGMVAAPPSGDSDAPSPPPGGPASALPPGRHAMTTTTRHTGAVAAHVLMVRPGELAVGSILMLRRAGTGWADGMWSVPAGHLDGDETVTAAAVREAREETGVRIEPGSLTVAHVMHRAAADGGGERVDFFLTAARWAGEPRVAEPDKADSIGWYACDGLPDDTVPYVRAAVAAVGRGRTYSEFGWPQ